MALSKYKTVSQIKLKHWILIVALSPYFEVFSPSTNLPLNLRKLENNALQGWKNTKEIIINHKGTRMIKDGED